MLQYATQTYLLWMFIIKYVYTKITKNVKNTNNLNTMNIKENK